MAVKGTKESKTIMTELIMPNDTNPLGSLMGGNLMRWMDIAGGICAAKHSEAHVVTASVDHVSFTEAIKLGQVIEISSVVTRAFNTSLEVYIEVHVSDIGGGNTKKSNHAYMTFVALDNENKRPKKIPEFVPTSEKEKSLFESAPRRRELRLILSGRMQAKDASLLKDYFENV